MRLLRSKTSSQSPKFYSLIWVLTPLILASSAGAGPPDGNPDILFPGSATLCEGDGTGGFACADIAGAEDPTSGAAVGDLNNDGIPDMAFGGADPNACLSDGSGAYVCADVAESSNSAVVGIGDITGDGNDDLIVADNNVAGNRFCANDGSGDYSDAKCTTFATAINHATEGLAIGELNGDSHLDVVFTHRFGSPAAEACLGDGAGGFTCQTMTGATGSYQVANLGDLNGDGHLDAVLAWEQAANTAVCLNDGSAAFTCTSDNKFGEAEEGAIGDINGDGDADIVWALRNNGGPGLNICLGDGTGTVAGFTCTSPASHDYAVRGIQLAELTGDSHLDAAIYVVESGANNKICTGDGAGAFTCADVPDLGTCNSGSCLGRSLVIADIAGPELPSLSVAEDIPAAPQSPVDVAVTFSAPGHDIAATAFSVDYDQACLSFDETDGDADNIPDAITFHGSSDFSLTVLHSAADTDGEIDISVTDLSPPFAALSSGNLVTITFTATCSPSVGQTITAPVVFSSDPAATFANASALDIDGTTSGGSVQILPGPRGDCNTNGNVTAADLIAEALEIFDDDGTFWADVTGSTFAGNPVGCDANADLAVNAGDISCTVLLIFGGTCGGGDAIQGASFDPDSSPILALGRAARGRGEVTLPIYFSAGDHQISSVAFSIDLADRGFTFDPADHDADGIPDAIHFPAGRPDLVDIRFDAEDRSGELDLTLAVYDSTLPGGVLAEITVQRSGKGGAHRVGFAKSPLPSFGDRFGQSVVGRGLGLDSHP